MRLAGRTIFFQNCSILDRNSPRIDRSLKLFKDTLFWFIGIPAGVITLVLLINTFVFLRASESALAEHGVFMKDITAVLLAIVFVFYSLIALLSVERNKDSTSSPLVSNQEKISELGLRVAFQR